VANTAPKVECLGPRDAEDRQRRAAGALKARGVGRGDRVVFSLPSSADLLCAVLGAVRAGIIPVLLNATLMPTQRERLAADADPVVTIYDETSLESLFSGNSRTELAPLPLTRPMHYTSGTTGRPKGVTTGLWDEVTAQQVFDDEADQWEFAAGDLHMVCSPMHHTVSIRFAAGTLLRGGSLVILTRFDAAAALGVLRRERPSTTFLAPTHLQRLLGLHDLGDEERFDSLRLLVHAGSPCPPSLKRAAMDRVRTGALWEFYGSTEGQFTVCSPSEWLERPGTVGRSRPGRTLTVDDDGMIWCRPPDFARFR
jgi:long-chain acyl-CoA synthetase